MILTTRSIELCFLYSLIISTHTSRIIKTACLIFRNILGLGSIRRSWGMSRPGSTRFVGNISAGSARRAFIGMQPSERGTNSLASSTSLVPKSSKGNSAKTQALWVLEHQERFKITSLRGQSSRPIPIICVWTSKTVGYFPTMAPKPSSLKLKEPSHFRLALMLASWASSKHLSLTR